MTKLNYVFPNFSLLNTRIILWGVLCNLSRGKRLSLRKRIVFHRLPSHERQGDKRITRLSRALSYTKRRWMGAGIAWKGNLIQVLDKHWEGNEQGQLCSKAINDVSEFQYLKLINQWFIQNCQLGPFEHGKTTWFVATPKWVAESVMESGVAMASCHLHSKKNLQECFVIQVVMCKLRTPLSRDHLKGHYLITSLEVGQTNVFQPQIRVYLRCRLNSVFCWRIIWNTQAKERAHFIDMLELFKFGGTNESK